VKLVLPKGMKVKDGKDGMNLKAGERVMVEFV
jgi:hypothetical protein